MKRSRLLRGEIIGNYSKRFGPRDHVFGVAAVEIEPGDLAINAHREIAAPAGIADETMTTMPTDTDPLTLFPARDAVADRIDSPGNLMTRHARILNPGQPPSLTNMSL
jgi:hypothetical protein